MFGWTIPLSRYLVFLKYSFKTNDKSHSSQESGYPGLAVLYVFDSLSRLRIYSFVSYNIVTCVCFACSPQGQHRIQSPWSKAEWRLHLLNLMISPVKHALFFLFRVLCKKSVLKSANLWENTAMRELWLFNKLHLLHAGVMSVNN